mgnify:CR=1 FL=1
MPLAEHEIVVVAPARLDLLVGRIYARADFFGFAEVERRAVNLAEFARGNEFLVHNRVFVGVERKLLIEDCALSRAREIEVGVVCEVANGWLLAVFI